MLAIAVEMSGAHRLDIVNEVRRRLPGHSYESVVNDTEMHVHAGRLRKTTDPDGYGKVRLHAPEPADVATGVRLF